MRLTAYELKDFLNDNFGTCLCIATQETDVAGKSIIIGKAESVYAYKMWLENGNLLLEAGSFYGYECIVDKLKDILMRNSGKLPKDLCVCGDASTDFSANRSSYYITKRSGDLRAMLFNIYGWGGKGGTPLRTELEQELLWHYRPDVVGFQEFGDYMDFAYRSTMTPKLLEIGYKEIPFWYSERKSNSTPIFYNPERVEIFADDSFGGLRFSNGMKDTSKSLTWAVFREKQTQKPFVFISTHFMWPDPNRAPEVTNNARVSDACELLETVHKLRERYGEELPIIAGGDLNCFQGSEPINKLLGGGMRWFYDIAATAQEYGYHGYPTYDEEKKYYTKRYEGPKDASKSMDFIFGVGDMLVDSYITVTDKLALISSDHSPKFADITLGFSERE